MVNAGEEIVDMETDKIVNSSEARSPGALVRLLAEVGEELPVGHLTSFTTCEAENDEAIDALIAVPPDRKDGASEIEETPTLADAAEPAFRCNLGAAGIDPAQVTGTGSQGRILRAAADLAIEHGSAGAASGTTTAGGQPLSSQHVTEY